MRYALKLSIPDPKAVVTLQWDAEAVIINNPTGSPVYFRQGGNDYPTERNADQIVNGATMTVMPVVGREFALAFGQPDNIDATAGNGPTVASVMFIREEAIPSFGEISLANLSRSEQLGGLTAFNTATSVEYGPIDMGAWGGLMVYINPTVGSAQGTVTYSVSDDQQTRTTVLEYPLWSGFPFLLVLPKLGRYGYIQISRETEFTNGSLIDGTIGMRTTMSEILAVQYLPFAGEPSASFTGSGSTDITQVINCVGLESLRLFINFTSWTGTVPKVRVLFETSPDATNWFMLASGYIELTSAQKIYWQSLNKIQEYVRVTIDPQSASAPVGEILWFTPTSPDPSPEMPATDVDDDSISVLATTWTLAGISALPTNSKLRGFIIAKTSSTDSEIRLGIGTGSAVQKTILRTHVSNDAPVVVMFGENEGLMIPDTWNRIWVYSAQAETIYITIFRR
jgi:hypothetical protein